MMVLTRSNIIAEHKRGLGDAESRFKASGNADFERHLVKALARFSKLRRRIVYTEITLTAGVSDYPAPAEMLDMHLSEWGDEDTIKPWDKGYNPLPKANLVNIANGAKTLRLSPAPTGFQIGCFGDVYAFSYRAKHVIDSDAANTSIDEEDLDLLYHLMLIEAVKELAAQQTVNPVQLNRGMTATANAAQPSALLELLEKQLVNYR
jgi:hypothetical protein